MIGEMSINATASISSGKAGARYVELIAGNAIASIRERMRSRPMMQATSSELISQTSLMTLLRATCQV